MKISERVHCISCGNFIDMSYDRKVAESWRTVLKKKLQLREWITSPNEKEVKAECPKCSKKYHV